MAQTIKLKRSAVAGRVPTTSDLELGEVALNTTDGKMYIKKSTGGTESIVEIGSGGVSSSFVLHEYTASASQTTFTGSDDNSNVLAYDTGTPPRVQVFLNGVLLDYSTDYTASNGTSVVLTDAASSGDLIQIAAYKSVTVDSDISLGDNTKILLGTGNDLELYHDGSNSIINDAGTGNLQLQVGGTTVLETSAAGVTVTGDITGDLTGNVTGQVSDISNHSTTDLAEGTNLYWTTARGDANFTTNLAASDTDDLSEGATNLYWTTARGDSNFTTNLAASDTDDLSEGATNLYWTTARGDSNFITNLAASDTDDLSEGATNLYWTTARGDSNFITNLAASDTDDLSEGATNLYYTTARANADFDTRLATKSTTDLSEGTNLYYTTARFDTAFSGKSTTDLTEGTNLYFTNARARSAISVTGSLSYNSTTGVISYTTPTTIASLSNHTTDNLSEGTTNLYYTSARANADFDTRLATKSTTNLAEGTNLYYTDARVGSYLTTNSYATQTYVSTAISNLVDSAPATLDTLNELAAALGDDPNFATTVSTSIGTKWTQDNTKISNWDTAYGWGNHASAGYQPASTALTTSTTFGGDVSGTYNAIVIADDSHNHTNYMLKYNGSTGSDFDSITTNGVWRAAGSTNNPTGTAHLTGIVALQSDANYGWQLFAGSSADIYFRYKGTSWGGWGTMWNSINDGSGSGLDADLLDGQHGSYYAPASSLSSYVAKSGDTMSGALTVNSSISASGNIALATSGGLLHLGDSNTGNSAGAAQLYYRASEKVFRFYALDGSGSTIGVNRYERYNGSSYETVWDSGNDGSGSGLDADLLDGQDGSYYAAASHNHSLTLNGDVSGSGTVSGTITVTVADDSHNHNTLYRSDNRTISPSEYGSGRLAFGFTSWANNNTAPYADFLHMRSYTDSSGGADNLLMLKKGGTGMRLWQQTYGSTTAYASYVDFWHTGNDGSGSGLDADLLDGQQGSYYQPASSAITTGNIGSQSVNRAAGLSDGGDISSHPGSSQLLYTGQISSSVTGLFSASDNSNSIITVNRHPGDYNSQLGFSSNGQVYYRKFSNTSDYTTRGWDTVWMSSTDGSGSGLDADLLDGQHGSYYLNAANFTGTAPTGSPFLSNFVHLGTATAAGYATDDGNWGSRLNVSSTVHAKIEVSQEANSMRSHWYAHTGQDSIKFGTSTSHDVELQRGSTTYLELEPGGIKAYAPIRRSDHHATGFLEGSYNNIGDNGPKTNPIYTIGSSYNPADSTLGNMYGIGYCSTSASFITGNTTTGGGGWGLYVAADGDARIFLNASNGTISTIGQHYAAGSTVWNAGNDGSGSGLDADLLDGTHKVDIQRELINVTSPAVTAADSCLPSTGYGLKHFLGYGPSNNDGHIIGMSWANTSSYGAQIYVDTDPNNIMAFRSRSSTGVWTSWNTLWHGANDGSGSGLDADLLDGFQLSSMLYKTGGTGYYRPNTWIDFVDSGTAGLYWSGGGGAGWHIHPTDTGNMRLRSGQSSYCQIELNTTGTNRAYIYADSSNNAGWLNSSASWRMRLPSSGSFVRYEGSTQYTMWDSGNDGSGSGLDADLLDGSHGSYYDHRAYTSTGNYLGGHYVSGGTEKPNSSALGAGKLKPIMLSGGNIGVSGSWNDVLWMSTYTGSDVKRSTAIISSKYDNTSVWVNKANYDSASWGTSYLFWNSGNDGSGSGLDADLLDGYHSAENGGSVNLRTGSNGYLYLYNWINVSNSGLYSGTNGAHFYPNSGFSYGVWRVDGVRNSYSGIVFDGGGDTVTGMFDSSGNGGDYNTASGWHFYYHRGNVCLGVAGSSTSSSYGLYEQGGGIYSTGNITAYSDRRVKENIRTIDNALSIVEDMRGVYYNKIDDPEKRTQIGFIAQEVDAIEGAKPLVTYAEDVDQYGVSYGNATALLVEAVKELSQQVKDLKKELEELKNG